MPPKDGMFAPNRMSDVVLLVKIVDQMYLETDGSATDRRVFVPLPPGIESVGYRLAGIQAMTKTENKTTNMRWNAEISKSLVGQEFYPATPNDLFAYVTADGEETQTELTDTTKFRAPTIRINLACSNSAGTSRESATVSLWLLFIFQT